MTESAVVYTNESDSREAGQELGRKIAASFHSKRPDAVIVFASSRYEYEPLLEGLEAGCGAKIIVGCSSAGEFVSNHSGEGSASAVALESDTLRFSAAIGNDLRGDRRAAAEEIVSSFTPVDDLSFPYRSALILTDALAGFTDELIEHLTVMTAAGYSFFGGGAGDDAQFSKTHVFLGTKAYANAAVALEILSTRPVGIGVSHGWKPASDPIRVTEVDGSRLISLNAMPAVEVFQEHAEKTGQKFDTTDPVPFFLHNVLGIDTGADYKLRVPLAVNEDGSVDCASDIPAGATLRIMSTTSQSAADAAVRATTSALQQMNGGNAGVAIFFDCVATRLRMGEEFGSEMDAVQAALGSVAYAGCNTYGQIARNEGQFSGFHNCTATVAVIPG